MNRRQFMVNLGGVAVVMPQVLGKMQTARPENKTPEAIYKSSYAIDAMCFAAAAQCEF